MGCGPKENINQNKIMAHGNHWECLGGTAEERVAQFIPLVCAKGDVGEVTKRTAKWFGRKKAAEEAILPMAQIGLIAQPSAPPGSVSQSPAG